MSSHGSNNPNATPAPAAGAAGAGAAAATGKPTPGTGGTSTAATTVKKVITGKDLIEKYNTDERRAAFRFQEQCFLMMKYDAISKIRNRNTGVYFKEFCTMTSKFPSTQNSELFKATNKSDPDKLFNLTSAQLSLLVPEIRIYKDFVDPKTKRSLSIELPFDDLTRKSKIEDITKTSVGRGGGVGLKSFTWKSLGTNPANKFSFGAELVLHFQNIEDLFEVRDIKTFAGKTVPVSYKDLIVPQRKFRDGTSEGSFTYNKDYFRIKVVCGWKIPDINRFTDNFIDRETINTLKETRTVLFLTLQEHNFDFKENGTVDLTIKYIAYSDSLASDPIKSNILFASPDIKEKQEKLQEELKILRDALEKQEKMLKSGTGNATQQTVEEAKKDVEKAEKQLENLSGLTKEGSYQRIIEGLLDFGLIYPVRVPLDFFDKQLRAKSEEGLLSLDELDKQNTYNNNIAVQSNNGQIRTGNPPADSAMAKIQNNAYSNEDNRNALTQATLEGIAFIAETARKIPGASSVIPPDIGTTIAGTTQQERLQNQVKVFKTLTDLTEEDFTTDPKTNKEMYVVKFFRLGSLLDVVLRGMFKDPTSTKHGRFPDKELKIILGNLTFYDYGNPVDSGLVQKYIETKNGQYNYRKIYRGARKSVNIADIPISLKVFTNWFVENVADPGLETMTFKDFLDKVINDLVIRALGTECREFVPRQRTRIRYKSFSVPANKRRTAYYEKQRKNNGGYTFNVGTFLKNGFNFRTPQSKIDPLSAPMENYLFIYGSADSPFDLTGDYHADKKKGIYHLYFGNEFGLVKNIAFSREDNPQLRAANIHNNLDDKKGAGKMLREKYNSNISMIGSNLFTVGGKIHITPSVLGTDVGRSKVLRDIGIGGYFDIINITNTIEDGKFVTELDTKWTARGDGVLNFGDKEIQAIPANQAPSPTKPAIVVGG